MGNIRFNLVWGKLIPGLFLVLVLIKPVFLDAQTTLDVVYPKEGQLVTATDSTFIFGSVHGPNVRLTIQDTSIPVSPAGTFLAYVPVSRGEFSFVLKAISDLDTVTTARNVVIPLLPAQIAFDTLAIDTTTLQPDRDLELLAGDLVRVSFVGTPGMKARFSVPGLVDNAPMIEAAELPPAYWGEAVFGVGEPIYSSVSSGYYQGIFAVPPGLTLSENQVEFELLSIEGASAKARTTRSISIPDTKFLLI